ncbi:hypothetical protein M405DRAFT_567941 [Rhizopogon salebrosus TDB-379]|nr:hypothetical protein M405DRAFT_567941 [Rhizopogon salebrosus TDB-379]
MLDIKVSQVATPKTLLHCIVRLLSQHDYRVGRISRYALNRANADKCWLDCTGFCSCRSLVLIKHPHLRIPRWFVGTRRTSETQDLKLVSFEMPQVITTIGTTRQRYLAMTPSAYICHLISTPIVPLPKFLSRRHHQSSKWRLSMRPDFDQ